MVYLPELYYFFDQKDFPHKKAILVTAQSIGWWSTHYYAEILAPKKGLKEKIRQGELPKDSQDRQKFIGALVQWLFDNSEISDVFRLYFDDQLIRIKGRMVGADHTRKFDHHDDTCCWFLHLTEQQFQHLQKAWQRSDLPEDLFYPEDQGKSVPYPSFLGKLLGARKMFTPKHWRVLKKE